MKKRIGMAIILFFAMIIQTTVSYSFFSKVGLAGRTLDVTFLLLIYLSLHRSFWTAWIWASLISLCCEALGYSWKGGQTLSYLVIATVLCLARQYLMLRTPFARFTFFMSMTALDASLQFFFGSFFIRTNFLWGNFWSDILFQGLINTSIATLLMTALTEFDYWAQGYRFSEQNVVFSDGRRSGLKII